MPNTYYSITDEYVVGLRWHDRGNYDMAAKYWDPLVEKGDCDAEYMTGLLYFLGRSKPQNNAMALSLWRKAAEGNQQRSQWALGDLYYQNRGVIFHKCAECGVEKDLVAALT
jgi:TPR repeat protein